MLSSCSGSDHRMLKQADAVMEEHPDSALNLLLTVDRNDISNRDLPYYALLMTQAMVKNDVPVASDSLVSIAYEKFSDDWWGDKGIRSSFYMGEVFFNQEKPREAMRHYLSAYEEAKRLHNHYWHAKAAERIADLFFNAYNYGEAAKYRKEAIEYFGKADRVRNQRFAVADLAINYTNDSKSDIAMTLIDSLYAEALQESPEDSLLLLYIRRPRIDILIDTNNIEEIDSNDLRLLDTNDNVDQIIDAAILKSKLEFNNPNSYGILNSLDTIEGVFFSQENKALILYAKYKQAKALGNSKRALDLTDSIIYYQDAMAENIIKESVIGSERDFYSNMSEKNRRRADYFLICFIAVCIITFLIWRLYRSKSIANRAELESSIESFLELKKLTNRLAIEKSSLIENLTAKSFTIDELRNEIIQLYSDIDKQRQNIKDLKKDSDIMSDTLRNKDIVLSSLFRQKWSTLNMLCNEYYEKGDSPNLRRYIIDSIEKELKKIGSKNGIQLIEDEVDLHYGGIIGNLKRDCSNLSQKDFTLFTLIIAGMSVKTICYLMGIKTGNFYVSKRRLIEKIKVSDSLDTEKFISLLL